VTNGSNDPSSLEPFGRNPLERPGPLDLAGRRCTWDCARRRTDARGNPRRGAAGFPARALANFGPTRYVSKFRTKLTRHAESPYARCPARHQPAVPPRAGGAETRESAAESCTRESGGTRGARAAAAPPRSRARARPRRPEPPGFRPQTSNGFLRNSWGVTVTCSSSSGAAGAVGTGSPSLALCSCMCILSAHAPCVTARGPALAAGLAPGTAPGARRCPGLEAGPCDGAREIRT
jgi:hypothetical protein